MRWWLCTLVWCFWISSASLSPLMSRCTLLSSNCFSACSRLCSLELIFCSSTTSLLFRFSWRYHCIQSQQHSSLDRGYQCALAVCLSAIWYLCFITVRGRNYTFSLKFIFQALLISQFEISNVLLNDTTKRTGSRCERKCCESYISISCWISISVFFAVCSAPKNNTKCCCRIVAAYWLGENDGVQLLQNYGSASAIENHLCHSLFINVFALHHSNC